MENVVKNYKRKNHLTYCDFCNNIVCFDCIEGQIQNYSIYKLYCYKCYELNKETIELYKFGIKKIENNIH